ncbi:hypothetical protein MAR_015463 [Mya arenaria]|uniref:Cysteine rich secreted protein n=1 Tax=Mya arenaria TaxID=6604 RepID=A0ABY7FJZ2_MYAAR|nr:uncharacterized protein LOC128212251 [Mya arenaria]WAR21489.1 hypothetical protein MAR_015463 [Mya arenaria]
MNILSATAMVCILLTCRVQTESEDQDFMNEGLTVNGASDRLSKRQVSGNGPRTDIGFDHCVAGVNCTPNGDSCCFVKGCCFYGWLCCFPSACCSSAAELAGSTYGHTMVILFCLACSFLANKHNLRLWR